MYSVFIVDDEEMIRNGLKKLIDWDKFGFSICGEANDGEEALGSLDIQDADILLTDLKMPFMDGVELSLKVKAIYPAIEIIVLTGLDDFNSIQKCLRNGVVDYLLKPINDKELISALDRVIVRLEEMNEGYPLQIEERITQSIDACDNLLAEQALDEFFRYMDRNRLPSDAFSAYSRKMCKSIIAYCSEKALPLSSITGSEYAEEEILIRLLGSDDPKEFIIELIDKVIACKSGKFEISAIDEIKDYIERNYNKKITLKLIADAVFLNPSYISQLFLKETGEHYNDYLVNVRLNHAKKLLKESRMSIQAISDSLGFGTSKYFSKVFKEKTGKQPSQYRTEYINEN